VERSRPPSQLPKFLAFTALLVPVVLLWVFSWSRQAATRAALVALQRDCAELRSQLESRERTLTDIQSSLERLQAPARASPEFHGRSDSQVKLRGFRVELTETGMGNREESVFSERILKA